MLVSAPRLFKSSRSVFAARASTTAADPAKYNSFGSPRNAKIIGTRPVSPHVTIYKFPLPAVTSIVHRITGVGMVGGAVLLSIPAILNPASIPAGIVAFKAAYPLLVPLAKLAITLPLTYHAAGGLRHVIWDYSSRGIDTLQEADMSSRYLVFGSIAVAVILAFLDF